MQDEISLDEENEVEIGGGRRGEIEEEGGREFDVKIFSVGIAWSPVCFSLDGEDMEHVAG